MVIRGRGSRPIDHHILGASQADPVAAGSGQRHGSPGHRQNNNQEITATAGRSLGGNAALATGLGLITMLLAGCSLQPLQELMRQGHGATVDCLHGERAQTDGDELRCEDWSYVRANYLKGGR
jgi:hypothetical protein